MMANNPQQDQKAPIPGTTDLQILQPGTSLAATRHPEPMVLDKEEMGRSKRLSDVTEASSLA